MNNYKSKDNNNKNITKQQQQNKIKGLQQDGRRFSFGQQLESLSCNSHNYINNHNSNNYINHNNNKILQISSKQINYIFIPQINHQNYKIIQQYISIKQQNIYIKHQNISIKQQLNQTKIQHNKIIHQLNQRNNKKLSYQLYPKIYQLKIYSINNHNQIYSLNTNMISSQSYSNNQSYNNQFNHNKISTINIGFNTINKILNFNKCLNIKLNNYINIKPIKPKNNLKIYSKQITYQSNLFIKPYIKYQSKQYQPKQQNTPYKKLINQQLQSINRINKNNQHSNYNKINNSYDKQNIYQNYTTQLPKIQYQSTYNNKNIQLNKTPNNSSPINQDILNRINNQLKKSHLKQPKQISTDNYSNKLKISQPIINQKLNQKYHQNDIKSRSNLSRILIQQNRQVRNSNIISPSNKFSDWIVDDIQKESNKIISKYVSSRDDQMIYHQNYDKITSNKLNPIQRQNNLMLQKSNSQQNLYKSPKISTQQYQIQRPLGRNISLSTLDQIKIKESIDKNNSLRINSVDNKKYSILNNTQLINQSHTNIKEFVPYLNTTTPLRSTKNKVNPSLSIKDLIAKKCKKLSIN